MTLDHAIEVMHLERRLALIRQMDSPEVQRILDEGCAPDIEALQRKLIAEYPDVITREALLETLRKMEVT